MAETAFQRRRREKREAALAACATILARTRNGSGHAVHQAEGAGERREGSSDG